MMLPILIAVGIIIVLLVVIISLRPADFCVTRKAIMSAAPSEVFAQVNDFHKWEAWSPWAKMDPACKNKFEGAPMGAGAVFSWAGNKKVGEGRMTILESRPDELIRIRLEFFKPFRATNTAEFTFQPEGRQTLVTWSMFGKNNFFSKAFGLFLDCDKMVGGDFEKGLAAIKSIVESSSKTES